MNHFQFNGKVCRLSEKAQDFGRGVTIQHFPDNIKDSYFEIGLVFPTDLWLEYDIRLYDYIEVEGHYVTLNKNDRPGKIKLVHVVDNLLKQEHE